MRRLTAVFLVLIAGCGLTSESGTTDPGKTPWQPGPLGGKADDTIVEKGSIAFGATVKAVTIQKDELHRYTFFASAGSDVQIAMSADAGSGNPDTYLQLEAPGGKLYTDDDGGFGLNSKLEVLGLPDSGTYTIYATTYRRAGTGDYTLGLTCLSGTCAVTPQMKTDDDHDGYSELAGDCDDTNPDSSPEAPEIPGNGKDDNCNGKTDEGCSNPATCDRPPRAPRNVKIQGNYGYSYRCRVTGTAEPSSKLTIYSQSRRKTLQSSVTVPTSGSFSVVVSSNCYAGDVLTLRVADQTSSSGKVWARVSGADKYKPLAVTNLTVSGATAGQVVVEGHAELGATVLLTNTSQSGVAVEVPAGAGFATQFKGALAAVAGDWIRVEVRDPAGNVGPAAHVQVAGSDTSAPAAPGGINVQGNYGYSYRCRVTGSAEPSSKLTIYSNARRKTLQSNVTVPTSGSFSVVVSSNCYAGDVLVLWVSDGVNQSAKVTATVSGQDKYKPLAPASVNASTSVGGQVTVTGKAEVNGQALVHNDSKGAGPVTVGTTWADLDAAFSATIAADPGDWLRVEARDAAGNVGPATMVKVGGSDTTAPGAPAGINVQGNYGYSYRCRVTGSAEPSSKLAIYSNARRKTLQSNVTVPASGSFSVVVTSNCYAGDVLVLWVSDGVNQSAKVTATVSGQDKYKPLAPASVNASTSVGGQVTVTGKAEVGGQVLVENDSDGAGPVTVGTTWVGLDASFSAVIAADPGDWLRVEARDAAGNVGPAAMVKVGGSDTNAPGAPTGINAQGNYGYSYRCRVTGSAEPSSKLTIYSQSRRKTLQSSVTVPASGSFSVVVSSNCYAGDVLVMWVSDGANQSAKVVATVSGQDKYNPLAPASVNASASVGGQVTVTGKAEVGGQARVHNDSKSTGPVTVGTTWVGLDATFSAAIAADPGDWLRVEARDAAGNVGPATMVKVGGSDTTAPGAPTGVNVQGNYGYSYRCRVTGSAEPSSKLTIYSNARRKTLQSSVTVPASGSFSVVVSSNCYAGDVLQLWVSDGVNPSGKVVATVSGQDKYKPLAPTGVSVSPVQSGKVTVSATVEIFGSLIVVNTYDNSQHSAQANSSNGKASVTLSAWHGDQLKLMAKDKAGNTGPALFQAVP